MNNQVYWPPLSTPGGGATGPQGPVGPRGPKGNPGSPGTGGTTEASGEAWNTFNLGAGVVDVTAVHGGANQNRIYSPYGVRMDGDGFVNLRGRIRSTGAGDRIVTVWMRNIGRQNS